MLINKMHICIFSDYIHKFAPHANMLLMSSSQTSAQPHSESQLRLSLQAELSAKPLTEYYDLCALN